MSWYIQAIRNYANFSGRARRKEYWMFTLINALIVWALYIPLFITGMSSDSSGAVVIFAVLLILYGLFILVPGISVVVRRLHDQDKSGAWYFISLVPFIGGIWMLVLMCTDGTYGPNLYGEDPKNDR